VFGAKLSTLDTLSPARPPPPTAPPRKPRPPAPRPLLLPANPAAPRQGFNAWIDQKLAASPQAGLMIYPEGHRSTRPRSLTLKRGMLHYAYSRKMPIQVGLGVGVGGRGAGWDWGGVARGRARVEQGGAGGGHKAARRQGSAGA
jgi:hypothetical protein